MSNKTIFLEDIKNTADIKTSFMIMKRLYRDSSKFVCILGDRTGDIKATIFNENGMLEVGQVIEVQGKKDTIFEISEFTVIEDYNIEDYLPTVKRPIEEIMMEIEQITKENVTSKEGIELNNYFFKNEDFVEKFKKGIAGVSMHHNYIGGLAEHTLNVMYLTKILCDRYECRRTETAVLAAKLHDIGKIYELEVNGPFRYSLRGEMEGHIVIGVQMIEEAVNANPNFYSEDFITRIKACLVQHHGKLEYGSPREMKTEEAFIVNFADNIDATMNKIAQIKENTAENQWSEYDRRIETRLYL